MRQAFMEAGKFDMSKETLDLLQRVTHARADYLAERTLEPVDKISGVRVREQSLVISVTMPISMPRLL